MKKLATVRSISCFIKGLMLFVLITSFILSPVAPVFAEDISAAQTVSQVVEDTPREVSITEAVSIDPAPTEEVNTTEAVDTETPTEEVVPPEEAAGIPEEPVMDLLGGIGGTSKMVSTDVESARRLPETDPSSGSLVYAYPLTLPPGRNDLTPSLSLAYNSSAKNTDSIIGYGWSFDIPSITRENKYGSEQLYDHNDFSSSLSGELVNTSGTSYAARVENGDFTSYTLSSNTWIAYDKAGTKYTFGGSAATRQDDPSDSSRIYRWMLEEIRDTNDNYIKYEYYKDNGQIYPSKITYTGTGTTDGIFEVNFNRESLVMSPKLYSTDFEVKTNYRITDVQIEENNEWVRKYEFDYTVGDTADVDTGTRKLLSSVTESGRDLDTNTTTTLEPTVFTYQESVTPSWTITDDEWELPKFIVKDWVNDFSLIQVRDVNGDAYPDVIFSKDDDYPCDEKRAVWLNDTHGGWNAHLGCGGTWEMPIFLKDEDNYYPDYGTRAFDYNGDLITDLVWAYAAAEDGRNQIDQWEVWKGTGTTTGWTEVTTVEVPNSFVFADNGHADSGVQITDVNNDGLQDIVYSWEDQGTGLEGQTYLGNGAGWDAASTGKWVPPHAHITQVGSPDDWFTYAQYADINGDRLLDVWWSDDNTDGAINQDTHINNGHGWLADVTSDWDMPITFQGYDNAYYGVTDAGSRVSDVNGDGAPDIVFSQEESTTKVYLNTLDPADPFALLTVSVPEYFANENYVTDHSIMADINADGMDDILYAVEIEDPEEEDSYRTHLLNNTPFTDLLIGIESPSGATADISYKLSSQYFDDTGVLLNPNLPFLITTVSEITTDDGFGNEATQSYTYAEGSYYFNNSHDRKFAGFGLVTTTDAVGNVTKTYYHQGNTTNTSLGEYSDHISKAGKAYRVEEYNDSDDLYHVTVNKWDKYNIGTDHDFVKLIRSTNIALDGDADHKDTSTEYTYDNANGNLLTKVDWGDVTASANGNFTDAGSDKSTETITYASNTGAHIVGLPSQTTTTDQSSNKVRETKYFYDNQTAGNVNDGNLTKEQRWEVSTTYQTWEKSYNANGTVATETDPRSKVTTYAYDTYNLYPATITNPLSDDIDYVYDYSSGKAVDVTDDNGSKIEIILDGLDRPVEEKISDPTSGSQVTKTTYSYDDTSFPNSVTRNDYLDASTARTSIAYADGLGRTVQTRTEMEDSGDYSVKDTVYNDVGLVEKESLPYTGSGTSHTSPTGTTSLYTSYTYDALERPLTITNNLGSTSNTYDQWTTTTTDPLSKVKDYVNDARVNLTSVVERDGASSYTTSYEWNLNGMLTKITDSLSNIRNFTYNGIGQRLTAEDLHASGDATFGSWTYAYDASGNLTQSVSPKGDTVNYTYDDINRPLTENWTGGTGTEITYVYDTCTEGIGRLCSATVLGGVATTYIYTPNGLLKTDTKTIGGTGYTTSRIYDRQGNITQMQLPDSSQMRYTFNAGGLTETMQRKEVGGSWTNVLTDIDYAPTDQVKYLAYTNGVTTTNTFDSTKLYRLTSKVTAKTGGSTFQSIAYTYDAVGNITNLTESAANNAKRIVNYTYDNLHRMLSATATQNGNPLYTHTLTYNSIGNILTKSDIGGAYQYNGYLGGSYANPHATTKINGVNRTYDQNGNTLTDGTNTNTWNYRNELTQVVGASTTTYTYDHTGERMSVTNGGVTTVYPNKSYDYDGTKKNRNLYLGEDLIATNEDNAGTITLHYVHADHLNGSSVVTSSTGTQDELLDYFPFGGTRIDDLTGSFSQKRKYIGEVFDSNTQFSYLHARYYNNVTGRFQSQDPVFWTLPMVLLLDPQQQNSYSYARNNPIAGKDPDGEMVQFVVAGFIQQAAQNYISTHSNIPSSIREASFASNYPLQALAIGSAKDGSGGNISSIASNFAVNLRNTSDQREEGTERNALRHTIWQGIITSKYGPDIAEQAGNAHEYNPFADLSTMSYSSRDTAGQTADLLNNQIGRQIAIDNPQATSNEIAGLSVQYFHTNGLYVVHPGENGMYNVTQTTTSIETYTNDLNTVSQLGKKGLKK